MKEMKNAEGKLTGVALYGGGNGHGVGLSQYGAKYLAEQGKTAAEIIACYFSGDEGGEGAIKRGDSTFSLKKSVVD